METKVRLDQRREQRVAQSNLVYCKGMLEWSRDEVGATNKVDSEEGG